MPIFRLKAKCFAEIFDFLHLKDLCAISETCGRLKKLVGEYFKQNYKSKAIAIGMINGQISERVDGLHTNFGQYAQDVQIFDEEMDVFRHVASSVNRNLRSIQFVMLTTTHPEKIKEILSNVESVTFIFCLVGGESYDNVLKYCSKLKCLSISDSDDSRVQWPQKTYPMLENLTVFDNTDGPLDGLKMFLKLNPQLKKLTTSLDRDQLFPLLTETVNLKLNELSFEMHDFDRRKAEETRNRLNTLQKNECFKRVRIVCYRGNQLVNVIEIFQEINGLVAIEFVHCIYSGNLNHTMNKVAVALATLKNLVELRFSRCEISLAQADILSTALVKLERVDLQQNSIETAMVFARRLAKLKILKIGIESYCSEICIGDLQNDRAKLTDAEHLIIYLPEEAYLDFKWTSTSLKYELVELRRNTSLNPIWPVGEYI